MFFVFFNQTSIRGEVNIVGCNRACQHKPFVDLFHIFLFYGFAMTGQIILSSFHQYIGTLHTEQNNERLTLWKWIIRGWILLNYNVGSTSSPVYTFTYRAYPLTSLIWELSPDVWSISTISCFLLVLILLSVYSTFGDWCWCLSIRFPLNALFSQYLFTPTQK